jgi:hypothetical protein
MGRLGKRKRLKKRNALEAMASHKVGERSEAECARNGERCNAMGFKGEVDVAARVGVSDLSAKVNLGTGHSVFS